MGYVEKLLARGERIVFVTRQHWFALVPAIVVDAVLVIVILAASVGGFRFSPRFLSLASFSSSCHWPTL